MNNCRFGKGGRTRASWVRRRSDVAETNSANFCEFLCSRRKLRIFAHSRNIWRVSGLACIAERPVVCFVSMQAWINLFGFLWQGSYLLVSVDGSRLFKMSMPRKWLDGRVSCGVCYLDYAAHDGVARTWRLVINITMDKLFLAKVANHVNFD